MTDYLDFWRARTTPIKRKMIAYRLTVPSENEYHVNTSKYTNDKQRHVLHLSEMILSSFQVNAVGKAFTGCALNSLTALPCPTSVAAMAPVWQSITLMSPRNPLINSSGVCATYASKIRMRHGQQKASGSP